MTHHDLAKVKKRPSQGHRSHPDCSPDYRNGSIEFTVSGEENSQWGSSAGSCNGCWSKHGTCACKCLSGQQWNWDGCVVSCSNTFEPCARDTDCCNYPDAYCAGGDGTLSSGWCIDTGSDECGPAVPDSWQVWPTTPDSVSGGRACCDIAHGFPGEYWTEFVDVESY